MSHDSTRSVFRILIAYQLSPARQLFRISNASLKLGHHTWFTSFLISRTLESKMPVLSSLPSSYSSATGLSLSATSFSSFTRHTNVVHNSLVTGNSCSVSRRCSDFQERSQYTLL